MSMAYQPKSYRKFLAGTVSAAVVASAIAPVASASFTDVAGSVHADDIATLVAKEYIKGYSDGTFKPDKPLTRGEAAIIFSRILKDAGVKAPEQGAGFPDVPASKAELAEAVAIVKAAGVMGGDEKGNFNPNANITREQMAKVVVEAFKLTKPPANYTTKITDLDKAGSWAREYIQTLEANGVTKNTEFAPKQNVTRGQFASFVVRAMDVKKEVSAADITAVKLVDEKTLEVTFNGELKEVKKEDFAIQGVEIDSVSIKAAAAAEAKTTVVVIKTKTALQEGKSYSVSYKGQTTDKAKVDVPVVTPKVESVSANNLNQILVTFNKELDKTSAENTANYTLEGKIAGANVNAALNTSAFDNAKATLQADGKSVLITLDTNGDDTLKDLDNQLEAKLTIDGVKTKAGQVIAKSENKFSYTDATVPTVESVKMEGNRVIVVKFSEFVDPSAAKTVSNYQLDGVSLSAYGAGTASYDSEKNEVRIPLTTALADKTYKLKVSVNNAIADAAGYKVLQVEKDLTVATDTAVAKVTGVEVASDKSYVLVKFDKALDPTNYATGAPVEIDGIDVIGSTTITDSVENGALKLVSSGAGTDFNKLIANGVHSVNVKNDTNNYLKDAYGVKVGVSSTTYTVEADLVKPTVTDVTVKSGATTTEVKFSEAVDTATAQNRFNYVLKNAKNEVVTINSATLKAGTTDTVVLSHGALDAGNYTLTIQNVKDKAANVMDTVTKNISVADTVAPTVSSVKYSTTNNTIYVYYSEAMNTSTITNAANYKYDNAALPAGTEITALSNSAVKIKLPASTAVAAGKAFAVSNNTTDVAGNQLQGFGYSTTLTTTLANDLTINSGTAQAKFVDTKTIEITLNKELKSIDASDFKISKDGGSTFPITPLQQNVSFVNKDGKATVTIKLDTADEAGTDALNSSATYKVDVVDLGGAKTAYGTVAVDDTTFGTNPFGAGGVVVADKIAPKLASTDPIQTVDADGNGQIDHIRIEFTEAIDNDYLSATTFSVAGYTVKAAATDTDGAPDTATVKGDGVNSKYVLLTVAEKTTPDTDATPNVQRVGTVKDVNGNEFTGLTSATASVDKATPVLLSARTTSANTLVLTFSENVKTAGTATAVQLAAQFAVDDDKAAGTPAVVPTSATVSGNTVTLTFGTSVFTTGTDIGSVVYTKAGASAAQRLVDFAGTDVATTTLADANTSAGF